MEKTVLYILENIKKTLDLNNEEWQVINSWEAFEEYIANYFVRSSIGNHSPKIKEVVYKKGSNVFPDIIIYGYCGEKIGVEVKFKNSTSAGWKALGGSVYETSKRSEYDKIFLVFGHRKLKEFRFSDFYKSVVDIRVTHSPRYYIDVNNEGETLFDQLKLKSDDANEIIDSFKKKTAENLKEGQSLWWIDTINSVERDEYISSTLKPWNSLDKMDKEEKLVELMVLFPEVFNVYTSVNYKRLPQFLMKKYGVYNPSIRDIFSAGGKVELEVGNTIHILPAVHGRMYQNAKKIYNYLKFFSLDEFERQARYEDVLLSWGETSENVKIEDLEKVGIMKINSYSEEQFKKNETIVLASKIYEEGLK